jgi:hypothetical protein
LSLYDYKLSQGIAACDYPFDALIFAAMRKADSTNIMRLKATYPELWAELYARYHAPGGCITDEERAALMEEIEVDQRCRERGGDSMADEKDPGEDKAGDEQTEQPPKEGEEKKDEGQAP